MCECKNRFEAIEKIRRKLGNVRKGRTIENYRINVGNEN